MSNRGVTFLAAIIAVVGLVLMLDAAATAVRHFKFDKYDCGSVITAKDPRNLVPAHARVPARLQNAYTHCQTLRSTRSNRATKLLVAGAVVFLAALAMPAVVRRTRRRRRDRVV